MSYTLEQYYPAMPGWTRGEPSSETDPPRGEQPSVT
jgi:hypothetical protein